MRFPMPETDAALRTLRVSPDEIRRLGKGAKLAVVRQSIHRALQAARVAPALPVLAEKRKAIALKRARRWFGKHGNPRKCPRHILAMTVEIGHPQ